MRPFRDWPIRKKLTGLFVAMACITAITISVPLGVFDVWGLRRAMAQDLSTLADVLARNSTAALTFRDANAATDILQALQAEPSVTAACIYTEDGKPLATYVRQGNNSAFVPPAPLPQASRFERGHLIQYRKIAFEGESVGTLYIESDLQRLDARFREYKIVFLATLLITLSLAFLLASRLQRPISSPLVKLVQTAEAISGAADYSIRAYLPNQDEFGLLVSAFNGMLDQIENRDRELRQHRSSLEDKVASRTAELLTANTRLKLQAAALEAASNSIAITDIQGNLVWTNPAFLTMTGYSSEEVLGQNPRILKSAVQDREFYSNLWATINAGNTWHGEIVNRRKNGTLYTEEMTIAPVSLKPQAITHFVAIKQDITERKEAEQALREAEEKYRAIFEDAVIGIFQTTPNGRPLQVNRAFARMHGYDSPGQFLAEVANMRELMVDPDHYESVRAVDDNGSVRSAEVEIYCRDRAVKRWMRANARGVLAADGKLMRVEGTVEDITDRKFAEERVQFLAYYDALTTLPNRTLLQDRLGKALAAARRHKERVAVLFLDLDRFKIINDSLGHSVGDQLLQQVAQRLQAQAREQDTVARVGGDEFLITLAGIRDVSDAAAISKRLANAMTAEFVVQGHTLNIGCSIGISVFPEHGHDAETLIKNADAAMYSAKECGQGSYQFFTETMNTQVVERLTLESSLRGSLDRHELSLVYQPQMNIATGRIIGIEALLRWQHPELGPIPPGKFIRVAETSGLIIPIGEWVLTTACSQARAWQKEGLLAVPIAVNVSALQFRHEGFLDLIRRVLRETQLAPEYLELELTESLLLSNADVMFAVLDELKDLGLKLAIDDFGTGYSSLSYLRQFHVDKLKIDRTFIRNVAQNSDDAAIASAIINMAKGLNLKVIAEGVETELQMSFLREQKCDEIQGYYFSKPLIAEKIAAMLRDTSALRLDLTDRLAPQVLQ